MMAGLIAQFRPSARTALRVGLCSILGLGALAWNRSEGGPQRLALRIPRPRPFLARLTGGFGYAPCDPAREPANGLGLERLTCRQPKLSDGERRRFQELDREASSRGSEAPGSDPYREAPWALAARPFAGSVDAAIARLETLSKRVPGAGRVFSDLSAAYLARASRDRDPRDLIRALDAAERAVQLDPTLEEALWNRAVALETLVRRPAIESWQRVVATEDADDWREEAATAVARLTFPTRAEQWRSAIPHLESALARGDSAVAKGLVAEHSSEVPGWIEDRMLLGWLPAKEKGEMREANRILEQVAEVARLFALRIGDSSIYEGIRSIAKMESEGDSNLLDSAVRALGWWREARIAFSAADYGAARLLFHQARRALASVGCTLSIGLLYWEARCSNRSGAYAEGAAQATASLYLAEVDRSARWSGRLGWLLGSAQSALGLDSMALVSFRVARSRLEEAGDASGVASLDVRLAGAEAEAGNDLEAWRHRHRALELFFGREDDPEFLVALAEAIYGAKDLGAPLASLALQNEEVRVARENGSALALTLALRHRADLLSALDPKAMEQSLAEARVEADSFASAEARERTLRQIDFVESGLVVGRDPRRALALAQKVVNTFEDSVPSLFPSALLVRAQARRSLRDLEGAAADLSLAMERIESLRELRQGPADRAALVAASSAIYDEAISLSLDRRKATAALDIAERARSRALLDWLGKVEDGSEIAPALSVRPRPFAELRRRLPADLAFVEYFVGRKELVVWLVRRDQVLWLRTPIDREALRDRVARLTDTKSPEQAQAILESLYDLLIRPFAKYLAREEPLQIVAADALLSVGFAGLLDRGTGRFLIEDHPLTFTPSLNVLVEGAPKNAVREQAPRSALVVADPEFNTELYPSLRRLPASRREGIAIGKLWPSEVLTGREATPHAVLSALPRHDLLHFGTHAEAFAEQPLGSRLILASDPARSDPGVLAADSLLRADLGAVRLVVLAACDSAGRPLAEGAAGLAWPLLARGVREVVAAVRPADDRTAAQLLGDFYPGLKGGLPVREALRRAQRLRLAATGRAPVEALEWSAFQLINAAESRQP